MSVLREDYGIDDAVSKVEDELGFTYVSEDEESGYFLVSDRVTLVVRFSFDPFGLEEATVNFEDESINIADDFSDLELYSSSLESCMQIVDTIKSIL